MLVVEEDGEILQLHLLKEAFNLKNTNFLVVLHMIWVQRSKNSIKSNVKRGERDKRKQSLKSICNS